MFFCVCIINNVEVTKEKPDVFHLSRKSGSYFARDAKYSHRFTSESDTVRTMFVARVLVGEYTKGSSDLLRPPPKDGGDINLYDSCVDDPKNPTIFVVFDRPQVYPEYLLQYRESGSPSYSGGATLTAGVTQPTVTTSSQSPYYRLANPGKTTYQPSTTAASATALYHLSQSQSSFASSQPVPARQSSRSSVVQNQHSQSAPLYRPSTSDRSLKKSNDSCVIA